MFGRKFCTALCAFSVFWAAPKCEAGFTDVMLTLSGAGNITIGAYSVIIGVLQSVAVATVAASAEGAKGAAMGSLAGILPIVAGVGNILMGAANVGLASVVEDNVVNKEKIKELEKDNNANKEKIKELANRIEVLSRR